MGNVDEHVGFAGNEQSWSIKMGKSKKILIKKTKRGGCRSVKNREKSKNKIEKFSVLGNNCFGLKAKKESLYQTIKAFNFPSCITLQETKLQKMGSIKLNDYQVFEKVRPSLGGGLLTAVRLSLSPVLISPIKEEAEIMVVQCLVNKMKIRVINGYGPQDDEQLSTRLEFWSALEQEIISAKDSNCCVLIQLDTNAKVGNSVISSDPNKTSENGKLLLNLVERKTMNILNCSPLYKGSITRQRVTKRHVFWTN